MRIRSLSTLLVAVLFPAFVVAQRTTPAPGRSVPGSGNMSSIPQLVEDTEIQVRVAYENNRAVGESIHVQLINSAGIPITSTFTTHEGTAEFRNQKFGIYQLHLEGPSIVEMTTPKFQIVTGEGMHMEWVHVQPKDPNQAMGGKPQGQISTAEMNIPEKARKEVDKGMELMDKNDLKEAREHFNKAVEIYPKYARAWNNIGVIKAKAGDRPGAFEAWHKAIDADDRFGAAYFNLARINLANKEPAEAQKLIEKGLVGNPGNIEGLFLLATAQAMQGNWNQALVNVRKVHSGDHKKYPEVHLIAGQGLAAQDQAKLAIVEYEIYLKEYPDSPRAAQVRQTMAQLQAKVQ
jgi:tetratricopeptide (TPR) repeat protein